MARRFGIIPQEKSSSYPKKIVYYDTETTALKVDALSQKMQYKLGVVNYTLKAPNTVEYTSKYKTYTNPFNIWKDISNYCKKKENVWIYAHNQQFDFMVTTGFYFLQKLGWNLEFWALEANLFIIKYHKESKTLIIVDSLNYFKDSLKDLGKIVKLPKLEVDFTTVSNEELEIYCRRDVEILTKVVQQFITFIAEHDLGSLKYTLASQAFTAYRHRFMEYPIYIHNNTEVLRLEREAYNGGINLCWFIGKVEQYVADVDINSLYPSVMQNNLFPTKLLGYRIKPSLQALKTLLKHFAVIAKVKLKTQRDIFPYKSERLLFPIGTFYATLSTPYLKEALKHNEILEVVELAYYEQKPIFHAFITYCYALRLEYSKKHNSIYKYMIKILMNSLYGKFGQYNDEWNEIGEEDINNIYIERIVKHETKEHFLYYHFAGKIWEKSLTKHEWKWSFCAIAAHVVHLANIKLLEYREIAGKENCLYGDTDSLAVTFEGMEKLIPYVHATKLGFLKVEWVTNNFTIFGCKDYTTPFLQKHKGIKNSAIEVSKGVFWQEHFNKFRSQLKTADIATVEIHQVVKSLKREYKKGIVKENGIVMPFLLTE